MRDRLFLCMTPTAAAPGVSTALRPAGMHPRRSEPFMRWKYDTMAALTRVCGAMNRPPRAPVFTSTVQCAGRRQGTVDFEGFAVRHSPSKTKYMWAGVYSGQSTARNTESGIKPDPQDVLPNSYESECSAATNLFVAALPARRAVPRDASGSSSGTQRVCITRAPSSARQANASSPNAVENKAARDGSLDRAPRFRRPVPTNTSALPVPRGTATGSRRSEPEHASTTA
jgi:hypothetical protein